MSAALSRPVLGDYLRLRSTTLFAACFAFGLPPWMAEAVCRPAPPAPVFDKNGPLAIRLLPMEVVAGAILVGGSPVFGYGPGRGLRRARLSRTLR